jgi:alpha-aminoadipic semialdehyde synthase
MTNQAAVENMISQSDLVISLLPVPFHPGVAELCIKKRKHLVTASYVSPAMKELHERYAPSSLRDGSAYGPQQGVEL